MYIIYFGITIARHLLMWLSVIIWCIGLIKMVFFFIKYKEEYQNTVLASLYTAFSMLTMILGSYIFPYIPFLGKTLLMVGIISHALFICLFTYYYVIKKFDFEFFLPSWFVTYLGILTGTVVGKGILPTTFIVFYGFIAFVIVFIPLVWKGLFFSIPDKFIHTKAIFLAPPSLCLAGYLTNFSSPHIILVSIFYICITKYEKFFYL